MDKKYTKTNWENGKTRLNATNMNHIEDGIETLYNEALDENSLIPGNSTKIDKVDGKLRIGIDMAEVTEHLQASGYVEDPEYTHTDNNYTDAEKQSLEDLGTDVTALNTEQGIINLGSEIYDLSSAISLVPEDKRKPGIIIQYKSESGWELRQFIGDDVEEDWDNTEDWDIVGENTEIDNTPTEDSPNAVSSGGVYEALSGKQNVLVSGTDIKTLNNESLLGSGNISIEIPTTTSDLINDSDFATTSDVSNAVSGKQNEITAQNKLNADLVDDSTSSNKFVTATEKVGAGKGNTAIQGVILNGTELIPDSNKKVSITSIDGASAYEIAVENGYSGTEQEWLDSLHASIGEFMFVANDPTAEAALTTYGSTYTSAISGVSPSSNTLSTILLMNDDDTTPTKTMMIATEDDGNSGYQFVYVGDLQSAIPSNVLTEDDIVDDFSGGANKVLSAEMGAALKEGKIDKIEIVSEETTYQDVDRIGELEAAYIASDGSVSPISYNSLGKYNVTPGETYKIAGRTYNVNLSFYYFYDSNDTPISGESPTTENAVKTVEVIAPSNASYVKISGYSSDFSGGYVYVKLKNITTITKNNQAVIDSVGDVSKLETTEKQTVVGAINEIHEEVNDVKDTIDEITELKVSLNLFDKSNVVDGKYISTWSPNPQNGAGVYQVSKYTGLIPVSPSKIYYISGNNLTGGCNIICYKSDGTTALQVLGAISGTNSLSGTTMYRMPSLNGDGASSSYGIQFKTPSEAAYVAFNVAFNNEDYTNTTMLELVGDSYDENFVPSKYQPYDPVGKLVIKPSAIDCDDTPTEDSEKPITSGGVYEALQNVTPETTQPLKILLIGSSHGMNTIAQLPFIASKSGIPVIVGNVYQGSMSMQWMLGGALRSNYNFSFKLWSNGSWGVTQSLPMTNILKLYDWDYISIQRSASDDGVWTTTSTEVDALSSGVKEFLNINHYQSGATAEYLDHNKTLQRVIDFIKTNVTNSPTILVNSNFSDSSFYATDPTNTSIIPSIEKMKNNFGIEYYSTAIALRNARGTFLQWLGNYINGTYPEISHNLTYDGQHLDYGIGCYLLSITLLSFILKMRGMGIETLSAYGTREEMNTNWWVSMSADGIDSYTEPNEYTMACAKACAKAALLTPSQQNDSVRARFRWSVDYNLANGVTSSNDVPFSTHQDKYETTLTGVTSQTVTVTSQSSRSANPVDITSQVYDSSTGNITINSVEGDIVITVA